MKRAAKQLYKYAGTAGRCADDPYLLERINEARQLIFERGLDVQGVVDWVIAVVDGGRIVLPEEIETVKASFYCNRKLPVHNARHWLVDKASVESCGCKPLALWENLRPRPYTVSPGFKPYQFGLLATHPDDEGTTVSITGKVPSFGVEVEASEDIVLKNGEIVHSDNGFLEILSVAKDATKGDVFAYASGAAQDVPIAQYPAGSSDPSFLWFSISRPCTDGAQIALFCRRKWRPLGWNENLDIRSIQALKFAMFALNANDTNDENQYAANIQLMENALEKRDASLNSGEESEPIELTHDFTSCLGAGYDH